MADLDRWRKLWSALGGNGDADALFIALRESYAGPGRFYHTLVHVGACLVEMDRARHLCEDPLAVELALWFHDVVYDPRQSDNEAQSAESLRAAAAGMGLASRTALHAAEIVMETAHEETTVAAAPDLAVARDADLAILGKPRAQFDAYQRAIRREYGFLADADYGHGRSRVLAGLLARPQIYCTELFRAMYEERARENLRESLDRLRTGNR